MTGNWRNSLNEELFDLYSCTHITRSDEIKENDVGGACGIYGRKNKCIKCFGEET
jgi:hypothetical protein